MNHPHFAVTAPMDVTNLLEFLKREKHSVNLGVIFTLSAAANAIPEFRWRIRDNRIVEHLKVNPSFTVPTEVADVFSFCTVPYDTDAKTFLKQAAAVRELMRTSPNLEDEEGRDDYLFLSALPWIRFTGIQHAMQYHPGDSVPRISWGKFYQEGGKTMMPLAVQVHHALVDGRHVGLFYEQVETSAANPKSLFAS